MQDCSEHQEVAPDKAVSHHLFSFYFSMKSIALVKALFSIQKYIYLISPQKTYVVGTH